MVRLSNQLESGRRAIEHVAAIEADVDDSLFYEAVDELPEKVVRNRA